VAGATLSELKHAEIWNTI